MHIHNGQYNFILNLKKKILLMSQEKKNFERRIKPKAILLAVYMRRPNLLSEGVQSTA